MAPKYPGTRTIRHSYRVPGSYRFVVRLSYSKSSPDRCYWGTPGTGRFYTVVFESRKSCYAAAGKGYCTTSEDTRRFEDRRPAATPPKPVAGSLPRPSGGFIYPNLGGGVFYGEASARLYEAWGKSRNCDQRVCNWHKGFDEVSTTTADRFNLSWPHLLNYVYFSALSALDPKAKPRIAASRLKGWQTPEGIHIGSTLAEIRAKYSKHYAFRCLRGRRAWGCEYYTRPYRLTIDGKPRRQMFHQTFALTLKNPQVYVMATVLDRDEGRCSVSASTSNVLTVGTVCWGQLKSARLRFTGEHRMVTGQNAATHGKGVPGGAYDDDGQPNLIPLTEASVEAETDGPQSFVWTVHCQRFMEEWCPPDRPTIGTPGVWAKGSFEVWSLNLQAELRPAPKEPATRTLPEFTFRAEFVDFPPFQVTVNHSENQ